MSRPFFIHKWYFGDYRGYRREWGRQRAESTAESLRLRHGLMGWDYRVTNSSKPPQSPVHTTEAET